MKMILTIVRNEDAPLLLNELNEKKYYVTKLATTGGFLKKGNTTLLMGIEDEQVKRSARSSVSILGSVSRSCIRRPHPPMSMSITRYPPFP